MFKKTKFRNGIILFISSYFPLYIIIFIQNISYLVMKCSNTLNIRQIGISQYFKSGKIFWRSIKGLMIYQEVYLIILCVFLMIFSIFSVSAMLRQMYEYSDDTFVVKVSKATNLNYEYVLTYFSAYVFPFITWDLSSISGIIQFGILWVIIGYIYIKNDLIYINPMLNILFKYNVYKAKIECEEGKETYSEDVILLTKKEKYQLNNRLINVIKENSEFYIEL